MHHLIASLLTVASGILIWWFLPKMFRPPDARNGYTASQRNRAQEQAKTKALQITDQLRAQDWTGVQRQFTPLLRLILPVKALRHSVDLVCASAGSLQKTVGDPVVETGWLMTSVKVPLQLSRTRLVMVLLMLPSGGLIGLNFAPYAAADFGFKWECPGYARIGDHREQDVKIGHGGNSVGATLTLPKCVGRYPCVVLVSGSGPCDRDSTVGANKPFKDLAVGLATNGIASLRFDKATHCDKKRLRKMKDKITLQEEYLDHATAAVRYCTVRPELYADQIYVLGHSLGAWITPTIATSEPSVAGFILMAAPGGPYISSMAIRQLNYLASLDGATSEVLAEQIKELEGKASVADSPDLNMTTPADKLPFGLGPAYWLSCRSADAINKTRASEKSVLILQGGRDYQATVEDDFSQWQAALSDKSGAEFRIYRDLNHIFVAGKGKQHPLEYDKPGHVDEEVILDISSWVKERSLL